MAVQLINNSALSSVESLVDFLSGKATHSVISNYSRIDEKEFISIWTHSEVKAASPVIEAVSTTLQTKSAPIRFLGVDPFLDSQFRSFAPQRQDQDGLTPFLSTSSPGVFLSPDLMEKYELIKGDKLTILTAGVEHEARILGPIATSQGSAFGEGVAVMDIANAQKIFGRIGFLDRIDVIIRDNASALERDLSPGLTLTDRGARKSSLKALLYSFQLNLAAMSLLALFVGIFLIYNFSMFTALSRREDLSLLLTLGADKSALVCAFLLETIILAFIGGVIGVGFGYIVALLSIEKVSSTISDIYFFLNIDRVKLTANIVLSGLGVGFLAALAGTLAPAMEVAATPPAVGLKRRSIEDRAQFLRSKLAAFAGIVFLGSLGAAWASKYSIFWGFVSAFGMTLAFALLTPAFLGPFSHYLGLVIKRGSGSVSAFLAVRNISASLSRTSIAVAALAVALSMTIGVDTMIHSFRESVRLWLTGALQGDIYISPSTTKWDHPLPSELVDDLVNDPRMAGVERFSAHGVYLNGKPVRLRIIDGKTLERFAEFHFLKKGEQPWPALRNGGLFISESLGYKFNLQVGSRIPLETPKGVKTFPVVAMVRDYSSDQGAIQIDREIYENFWGDQRVQSLALFLKTGIDPEKVKSDIVEQYPGLDRTIASNVSMRENILKIFDKTFAPTATLKGVTLMVALLGIATALMAIFIERSKEMGVLGYLGMRPTQLALMNLCQAVAMGLAAFLIACVCGSILTYIITLAINYRSFGWSVDIMFQPMIFFKTLILTIGACLVSAVYPSIRAIDQGGLAKINDE